jgi:antibiotic biosynthesis monooxygenase (ABM) superfamily enzyme
MAWRADIVQRLKQTAMIWLAVYPSVLLVMALAGDRFRQWPLPLRVLASTLLVVPLVVNLSAPLVQFIVATVADAWRRISRTRTHHK